MEDYLHHKDDFSTGMHADMPAGKGGGGLRVERGTSEQVVQIDSFIFYYSVYGTSVGTRATVLVTWPAPY